MSECKSADTSGSGESGSSSDTPSVRELLGVIMKKDRLLRNLLERLTLTNTASTAATESRNVTTFQIMPNLSKKHLKLRRNRRRGVSVQLD